MTTFTHSTDMGELVSSLRAARRHFKRATLNRTADDGTRYADIDAMREATDDALSLYDLLVVQFSGHDAVETLIVHTPSGQWLAGRTVTYAPSSGPVIYGPAHAFKHALGVLEATERKKRPFARRVPQSVSQAFERNRLSRAQVAVILKSHKSDVERIAAADRLGGQK